MSKPEPLTYQGTRVGTLKKTSGMVYLDWAQSPFYQFSNEFVVAFGMSCGLAEKLKDENVVFIEVENWSFPIMDIFKSQKLKPSHPVFDNPPEEDQYLIRVGRY